MIGAFGLVGSSNLTYPGLAENVELNVQITGRQVNALRHWYEEHWKKAEDVTEEILRTIERHRREYLPFDVYAKPLQEFFRGHEMTASEWENSGSRMYAVLDEYQEEGYQAVMKIARQYGGAFLCDGVGLGKTLIGLVIIERLVMHDRKRVALFVPKAYLCNLTDESITDEPSEIIDVIRCKPDTPRRCIVEQETLSEIRKKIEKHIKNSYLKKVQAPAGVWPVLKAWMEITS